MRKVRTWSRRKPGSMRLRLGETARQSDGTDDQHHGDCHLGGDEQRRVCGGGRRFFRAEPRAMHEARREHEDQHRDQREQPRVKQHLAADLRLRDTRDVAWEQGRPVRPRRSAPAGGRLRRREFRWAVPRLSIWRTTRPRPAPRAARRRISPWRSMARLRSRLPALTQAARSSKPTAAISTHRAGCALPKMACSMESTRTPRPRFCSGNSAARAPEMLSISERGLREGAAGAQSPDRAIDADGGVTVHVLRAGTDTRSPRYAENRNRGASRQQWCTGYGRP